eukprot:1159506-Rhodomonas_salina.1
MARVPRQNREPVLAYACPTRCPVLIFCTEVSPYACPTRCPGLRYGTVVSALGMPGTDEERAIRFGQGFAAEHVGSSGKPVKSMDLRALSSLARAHYAMRYHAMPGTALRVPGYAALSLVLT